jgi:hypothetical protein
MQFTDLSAHQFFGGPVASPGRRRTKIAPLFPTDENAARGEFGAHAEDDDEDPSYDHDVQSGVIIREEYSVTRGADDYSANNVVVGRQADAQEIAMLLPVDTRRTRFFLRNSGAVAVVVGKRNMMAGEQGWVLAPGTTQEFSTTADVYAVVPASAPANTQCLVSVWAERNR